MDDLQLARIYDAAHTAQRANLGWDCVLSPVGVSLYPRGFEPGGAHVTFAGFLDEQMMWAMVHPAQQTVRLAHTPEEAIALASTASTGKQTLRALTYPVPSQEELRVKLVAMHRREQENEVRARRWFWYYQRAAASVLGLQARVSDLESEIAQLKGEPDPHEEILRSADDIVKALRRWVQLRGSP